MTLRIATWNINSVRLRLNLLERLIATAAPDIICLQETKTEDQYFPHEAIDALGYPHRFVSGMKGYNGVAILSRLPFKQAATRNCVQRSDCRYGFVTLAGGIELHNCYVPAGGDIPDPKANEKFAHKLAFLEELAAWWADRRKSRTRAVLVGDLNVAPLETDVWSHTQLLKVVSHTPVEVKLLKDVMASHEWTDAVRHFIDPDERLYTWWSYRAQDWAKSDRGRRLDHVWVTPALKRTLRSASVLRDARGWQGPSDHVPVIVDLDT